MPQPRPSPGNYARIPRPLVRIADRKSSDLASVDAIFDLGKALYEPFLLCLLTTLRGACLLWLDVTSLIQLMIVIISRA